MYFPEIKGEERCGLNNSGVGRKFVSPQLVSAKPVSKLAGVGAAFRATAGGDSIGPRPDRNRALQFWQQP